MNKYRFSFDGKIELLADSFEDAEIQAMSLLGKVEGLSLSNCQIEVKREESDLATEIKASNLEKLIEARSYPHKSLIIFYKNCGDLKVVKEISQSRATQSLDEIDDDFLKLLSSSYGDCNVFVWDEEEGIRKLVNFFL